jgi:hypothetical protein
VEVEQAPDGTLISCVNPVTGEELGGGNYSETYEGTAAEIAIDTGMRLPDLVREGDVSIYFTFDMSALGGVPITVMVYRALGTQLYANNMVYNDSGFSGLYAAMDFSQGQKITALKLLSVTNGNIIDGTTYAESVPATMLINYHPMPE